MGRTTSARGRGRGIWVDVRRRGEVEHCGRGRVTHGGSVGREASIGKGGQTEEHPQEDPDYIGTCETIAKGLCEKGGTIGTGARDDDSE